MKEALLRGRQTGAKSPLSAAMGLVREGGKGYISANFIFSYDPRSESGPERTRSFLLPECGLAKDARPDELSGRRVPKQALKVLT